MKCRVCGRELDPQKSYCDKCGTPVDLSDKDTRFDGEFSWNTIDFPKPKKPKDIEMAWPDMNRGAAYVASDATEGFYTKPDAPNDWPLPQSSQRQQAAGVSRQSAQPMPQTQPVQPVQSVQSPAQISRQQQDERIASAVQNMDASIFTPQNMVWTMSQPAVRPQSVQQAQATVQARPQQSVQTQIQPAAPVQAQAASVQQAAPQATVQPQMQQTQSVQQQAPMYYTQPAQMQQTQPVTPVQAPVYTQPVQPVQQMQQAPQQTVQTPVQPMQQTVQQPAQQTPLYYSQPVPVQQVAQAAPQATVQPQVQPVQQQAPMYYTQPTPVQTMQQNVQQPAQQAPLYYSQPVPVQQVAQATVQPQVQPMQQTVQTPVQSMQQAAPAQQPGFFSQPLDAVAMQQTQQSGVFFAPPQMGAVNMGGVSGATIGSVGAAGIAGAAIGAGMTGVGQRAAMTGAAQQGKQPYAPINMDAWLDEQFKVSPDSDRFFTFTKQGEDFQRQLNDEYRKYTQKFDTRDLEPIRQKTEQIRQKTEQRHQEANYSEDEFSFTAPQKQAQDAARAVQHSSRQAQAEARAAQQSVERTAKESGTGFDINDEFIGFKKAEETKKPKEEFDWNFDTRTNADKSLEDTERAAADAKVGAGLAGAAVGAAGMAASKAAADKEAGLPEDIEAPKAPAEQRTVVYSAAAKNAIPTKSEDFSKLSEDLFENGEPVTEFDRMIVEGTTDTSQLGDSTLAISNEQLRKEIEEVSKKVEEAYGNTPDVKEGRQKRLEAMAAARAAFFAAADAALEDLPDKKELAAKAYSQGESASTVSDAIAKNESAEKAEKDKAAKAAAVAAASAAAVATAATAASAASSGASANAAKTTDNTIATDAAVNRQMSERDVNALFDDKWDRELEDEGRKKGGFFGKLIRFLIVVIILFLIADFAVTKFMGDGPVKQFFHNVNEKVYEKVEPIKDKFGKKEQVETDPQKIAANEMNENIKQITFDDSKAKYQATLETNYEGLASSEVVTDPEKLAAVTRTIVGYNSSWISYVNTTTDISCLSYLKTDGSAYRSAANFSGLGKITEEYKKLNIGEIRADDDFVYVFTNEDITIKENGSSASTHSDMIYRLQLVGEEYKILDYMTIQ